MVEIQGVFSFPSIVEYTGERRSLGGIIPVGTPRHVAPGARRWWRAVISEGVKVLLAIKNCDRMGGEQEAICGGKVIVNINAHEGEGSGGRSCSLVDGGDRGVPGSEVLLLSSDGPPNVSIFYWKFVA